MLGSLRVGRWGATGRDGFDHVGEDDARLGDVEGSDGRVHLVETLAAAQKFGIDRADLVEHLAQFAEVGEELANFGVGRIRHVTVIGLARGLKLPVVAEGVETEGQLAFLAHEGCKRSSGQGYLPGRPYPIEEYAELVGRLTMAEQKSALAG